MNHTRLGQSGLQISRLCLGCMSFGAPERGPHAWTIGEEDSRAVIRSALEQGITFFDTANSYSLGQSEEILGRAIRDFAQRDEVVIATKVYHRMRPGPGGAGLSRKAILQAIDDSLARLGTDYVDLYQVHRWDYETPIEETMEALHDVVKAGKARYIGASSMFTWQFAKAQQVASLNGWTRFTSMQPHLNLLYREEEREMLPYCADQGLGVIPWSPVARGRLARDWRETSARQESDMAAKRLYDATIDADRRVIDAVGQVAGSRGVSRAEIALAWVLSRNVVSAPIIGARTTGHLDAAVKALSISLTADECAALEAPYVPHAVAGHT